MKLYNFTLFSTNVKKHFFSNLMQKTLKWILIFWGPCTSLFQLLLLFINLLIMFARLYNGCPISGI